MSGEDIENGGTKNKSRGRQILDYLKEAAKPLNFFTLALVIVATLQTCVLTNSEHTLRNTLKTNKISERAFVSITLAQIFLAPNNINPEQIVFGFSMINGGNTPTSNLKFTLKCAIDSTDDDEPWGLLYANGDTIKHSPAFIGPKAAQTAYCSFPFDKMKEIALKHSYGYVLADISYKDRLDPEILRRTQMSLKIEDAIIQPQISRGQPQTVTLATVTFQNRGKHNCADEECPVK